MEFVIKGNWTKIQLPFLCMFVLMRTLSFIFLLVTATLGTQNSTQKNYNTSNGLTSLKISDITQDHIGYLWIGTYDNGLIRFDGNDFDTFNERDNLPSNKINALTFINDSLFVATNKGLAIKTISDKFIVISDLEITKIKVIKGAVLLATNQGVYAYKNGEVLPLKLHDQIDLEPTYDVAYFNSGYYIASHKALWYVDKLQHPEKMVRIHDGEYVSLDIIKDNMYASTTSQGVHVFQENSNQFYFKNLKNITSLAVFENEFWLATGDNGIYVYDIDYNFEKRISKYNGLKVNNIRKIYIDNRNNCWIATYGNGLYVYTSSSKQATTPTSVYFENIEIDYKALDSIPINAYKGVLSLRPNQNSISFTFKAVDLNATEKMEYQWRLNDNIGPWTTKSSVDFASLNPGDYTFEVKAKSGKDATVSRPMSFSFFIDMPIYKKDWFIYSSIGLIIFISTLVIWLIIRNIRRKNEKRIQLLELNNHLLTLEQKALQLQMNPHFIFNVLNNIKALGSAQKEQEMHEAINNFAVLLRSILNNSRKDEISLQEEIDTIQRYVALEQQMSQNSFQFIIDTSTLSIDKDEILIPSMIVQPFIENAIKHGINHLEKEGVISVTFEVKGNFLICIIKDNGVGYKTAQSNSKKSHHKSVALHVTKERIEHISGAQSFYISEITDKGTVKGTKVWFKVPLKTEF